jgi:enolase-phosphatase E1
MTLRAAVIDIEGTTSPAGFVVTRMYPYSRQRFASWLAEHPADPDTARAVAQVRAHTGQPDLAADGVVAVLNQWLDQDRKVTALKTIQGQIWARGFAAGDLVAPFFADVIPALRGWHTAGLDIYVYSSGSVTAQRAWFRHSTGGDLRPLIRGYFDTETAGPKRAASSYQAIATAIGRAPDECVFLSDLIDELDAARGAGWHTVGICRPGEPHYTRGTGDHLPADSLARLDLTGDSPKLRLTGPRRAS